MLGGRGFIFTLTTMSVFSDRQDPRGPFPEPFPLLFLLIKEQLAGLSGRYANKGMTKIFYIFAPKHHMPAANWSATRALFDTLSLDFQTKNTKQQQRNQPVIVCLDILQALTPTTTSNRSHSTLPVIASSTLRSSLISCYIPVAAATVWEHQFPRGRH